MKKIYLTLVERTVQLEIGMKCTTQAEVQKVPAKQLSIGSIFDWNSFKLIVNVPQISKIDCHTTHTFKSLADFIFFTFSSV